MMKSRICLFACLFTFVLAFLLLPLQAATLTSSDGKRTKIGGIVWKWQRTGYNNDTAVEPPDSARYTILLMPEGHLSVRLDCNTGGGRYTLDGSSLTLNLTHTTMAACPPDSLAQKFMKDLAAARIAFLRDGKLYLDLMFDSGTMKFAR
jgi:para-nitrobenzyl esterase